MLNKRLRHEKLSDYVVQFIGYSADIVVRKGNTKYANLDFIVGAVFLFAKEGSLFAPNLPTLSCAVAYLPSCIDELKSLVKSVSPDSAGHRVELRRGDVEICVNRGAEVERFASQLARRYRAIEPLLEQAEEIGSEIERMPFENYIDELAKTGIARVVSYGYALLVDGELTHYPERRTVLTKPTGGIGMEGRSRRASLEPARGWRSQ
jgi:hypothetical protein